MLTVIGLVALSVAALTAITVRDRRTLLLGIPAALIALLWLALPGTLPDQVIRSAALIAVVAFAITTLFTDWSVTHRGLASVVTAAMGVTGAFAVFGWSWDRLHWWVAHQAAITQVVDHQPAHRVGVHFAEHALLKLRDLLQLRGFSRLCASGFFGTEVLHRSAGKPAH